MLVKTAAEVARIDRVKAVSEMTDAKEPAAPRIYEFGGFRLELHRRVLFGTDGQAIPLSTKSFDTLVYFLEHPGEVIDRGTLLAAIWPKSIVDENNLSQAVAVLRRALGAQAILTVPRQGYQFALRVSWISEPLESHATEVPPSESPVLGRRRRWALVSAVAGIVAVASSSGIIPIPAGGTGSSEQQSNVGFEPLGGDSFETEAGPAADGLPTESYQAYVRFLAAQEADSYTADGLDTQIAELSAAVRLDSRFALAYAYLASAYASKARLAVELGQLDIEKDVGLARDCAERAIELDPSLGEAHAVLAIAAVFGGELGVVRDELRAALRASPNNPMVVHIAALYSLLADHRDDARTLFAMFERFDRYGFDYYTYYLAGDLVHARERADQAVKEQPTDVYPRINLALYYTLLGEDTAAQRELRLVEATAERNAPDPVILADLVYIYGRMGMVDRARDSFARLVAATPDPEQLHAAHWVHAHLGLGDTEGALSWARRVADHPFPIVPGPQLEFFLNTRHDPALDEPRFAALRNPRMFEEMHRLPGVLE